MESNRRILIVDDQEDLRTQVAKMLKRATAGAEASNLLEQIRRRIAPKAAASETRAAQITYQVDIAAQGQEAFEMIRQAFEQHNPYALMFLDMRMPPGWDGMETALRIRSIDRELQIVVMTAYADYDQEELVDRIGEPDKLLYIKKPFHPEEIRQLALALTEKWNTNRREKDHLVLTNRLMRENSFLTRQQFQSLRRTYRCTLNAFISFLEADFGVLLRSDDGNTQVVAASSDDAPETILPRVPKALLGSATATFDERRRSCYLPLHNERFEGALYLEGKNVPFAYEHLQSFLDILLETAGEVLLNAFLLHDRRDECALAVVGAAAGRIGEKLRSPLAQLEAAVKAAPNQPLGRDLAPAAQELHRLADDIAQFAASGQTELRCLDQPLRAVIDKAVGASLDAARLAGVQYQLEVPPDLTLACDGPVLAAGLAHLVRNAVEAFAAGKGGTPRLIRITAAGHGARNQEIRLEIADNAGGMTPEQQKLLFEPFAPSGKPQASGLGSAAARQVIERHQGRIACETVAGRSTAFVIVLPIAQPQ